MAYAEYRGRNIGRLMYFLYSYDNRTDSAIFDTTKNSVTLYNDHYATYTWDGNTDIPTFDFALSSFNETQAMRKLAIIQSPAFRVTICDKEVIKNLHEAESELRSLSCVISMCKDINSPLNNPDLLYKQIKKVINNLKIIKKSFWEWL